MTKAELTALRLAREDARRILDVVGALIDSVDRDIEKERRFQIFHKARVAYDAALAEYLRENP